jgi:energy-coupling factor transporter ATP-binding protein EcfA2
MPPFLRSLTIGKYRDLEPCALRFHPAQNILLGKNGTGKTTLLDLVSMIVRSDLSSLARTEFDITYAFELSIGETVQVRIDNRRPAAPSTTPTVVGPETHESFLTTAKIQILNTSGPRVTADYDGHGYSWSPPSQPAGQQRINLVNPLEPYFLALFLLSTNSKEYIQGWNVDRFDEGLGVYNTIFSSDSTKPALEFDDRGRGVVFGGRFLPGATSTKFLRSGATPSSPQLLWGVDELPFLGLLRDQMGFSKAEYFSDPREKRPSTAFPNGQRLIFSNFGARFYWADGTFVSHDQLSYGQKRLLALVHYTDCNPHFIVADELVNGLHHEWISFSLDRLRGRQSFLTSQNPLLFDYLSFENPDDLAQQIVVCSTSKDGGRPKMRWRQLEPSAAQRLYSSYEVGVQYVSEILQTEGLW